MTIQAFVRAFRTRGFAACDDSTLEEGVEKVAIFGKLNDGILTPTHAALQLASGEWTSKIGPFEDVTHTSLRDVVGPLYGEPVFYLSRPRTTRI
jgi:hypothetical protein